jgi:hypothetical protein
LCFFQYSLCNVRVFYISSSVVQEIYFKSGKDIYEFFPWLGIIGFGITLIESFFMQEIFSVFYTYTFTLEIGLLWLGFVVTLVCFTSIAPFFIKRCSASMFNISLVSQIFWSYLVEVLFGDSAPKSYEYYIGFCIIIIGIYFFNKYPVTILVEKSDSNELSQNLLEKDEKKTNYDNVSDKSSVSGFSAERKYNYYRNPSISNKANKYLNHQSS